METYENALGLLFEYKDNPIASSSVSFTSFLNSITRENYLSTISIVDIISDINPIYNGIHEILLLFASLSIPSVIISFM